MIYIDDAGVGCLIGKSVIVGYNSDTKETVKVFIEEETQAEVCKASFIILNEFNPSKEEVIKVCRGMFFNTFARECKGIYNIERTVIDGEVQDIVENAFFEHLYSIGVPKSVKLNGKDYKQLHFDLVDEIFKNPKLLSYIKPMWKEKESIQNITYKVKRLYNEFPHLYNMLVS